jgi:hypothetical protein
MTVRDYTTTSPVANFRSVVEGVDSAWQPPFFAHLAHLQLWSGVVESRTVI